MLIHEPLDVPEWEMRSASKDELIELAEKLKHEAMICSKIERDRAYDEGYSDGRDISVNNAVEALEEENDKLRDMVKNKVTMDQRQQGMCEYSQWYFPHKLYYYQYSRRWSCYCHTAYLVSKVDIEKADRVIFLWV